MVNYEIIKIRKKNYEEFKQSGGKLLGSGGFGCVLKPHIKCKSKKISGSDLVSKVTILKLDDEDDMETLYNEINISKTILKLDKNQKYLAPIIDYCEYDYNTTRNDIKKMSKGTMDSSLKYKSKSKSNKKKIKKCIINKHKNFLIVNLILKNSGRDLTYYISNKSSENEKLIIKRNMKEIVHNLCLGLEILHDKHIVHKDIKLNNICILIKNNHPYVKHIDFGLSEDLSKTKHSYSNVHNSGTPCYMSIDFVILQELKYQGFKDIISNKNIKRILTNNLFRSIKNNLSSYSKKGLNKSFLSGNSTLKKHYDIKIISQKSRKKSQKSKNIIVKKDYLIDYEDVDLIVNFILKLYKNSMLLKEYFKKHNGINTKLDIFSLGLVFFDLQYYFKTNDIVFVNLIKNMIEFTYINRFNINQCLNHQYLQNKH